MPKSGPQVLREAREKANMTREQLSMRMECISAGTIKRWEYGESRPDSSDVARIGQLVNDDRLWPRWMCAVDDEYARRHPDTETATQAVVAVINAGYQMADVAAITEALGRDLMDGRLDDKALAEKYVKEAEEAIEALNAAVATMRKGG